ncbi:hypothetical protein [cf. Phormidesmis sp. LEGE 11477]|uniref:hypothetical protein n=1 Tax=cf. Phormidesmis sp. LEGE 11477 TaxID=1828680 RepID=UPI0018819AB7|nr:hypothetical protein [cf. Phormidesmis sp. LEGE 11477]MBE9064380.1 hypothetical protein [cf. Phormidesmis sp. LEGE 11477]
MSQGQILGIAWALIGVIAFKNNPLWPFQSGTVEAQSMQLKGLFDCGLSESS